MTIDTKSLVVDITQRSNQFGVVTDNIKLDYLQREKGRFKITSAAGHEVRLFLERGKVLQPNEILKSACGHELMVVYAEEEVMTAMADSWKVFSQVCYHMGNRHVRLQVGERWIRFKPDHVLRELAERFGLTVTEHSAVFTPEAGAYAAGHSHHHHDHTHDHKH